MYRALLDRYPYAHCELDFTTPLELLVATILSAQTTDQRVNLVTPALFARYADAADYAAADRAELETMLDERFGIHHTTLQVEHEADGGLLDIAPAR